MKQANTTPDGKPAASNRNQAVVACTDPEIQQLLISVLRESGLQPVLSEALDHLRALLAQEETVMAFSPPRVSQGSFRDVLRAADRPGSKVPVIICSESFDKNLYIEAMQLGAFEYLAYPYRREEVAWVVNNALSWSSPHRGGHA